MKKQGLRMAMVWMAIVLMLVTGMTPAMAEGDVIINDLTAQSIFDDLGDALNYGTVAREWEQNAHAETSACVDYMDRYVNTIFANTDSTYFHAMNYTLEVGVSAPKSLNGMSFALYKYEGGKYVRCAGTEKTITSNDTRATLTWDIGNDLKNTRLYVFQISGEDYIENGQQNSAGLTVTNGPSLSSSAHNNNYIGKMVYHKPYGEGDSLGIFNTTKYSPSLTFGPETRAYYKKWNQELQKDEYFVIDPNDKDLEVQNVLINYYYTDQADFNPATDNASLKMGYMKMDGMSFVNGQFMKSGDVIGVTYVEEGGYADKLLDQAEKVSKKWGNLGGGEITSLTPDTTGTSTVTGPVTDDGYVVSLYDMEVGADGVFQVKKDTGWNGIPVAENEYAIINLICPSKDGKVLMGVDASDITYFYKEGQAQGEGVAWGGEDSNSSQRVIFNFVYADENGVMQPFEGTIKPTARHGGTLLAPKAYVKLDKEVHNGAIIADKVYNEQEIHQRNLAPLGRRTWITMNGGYLKLEKASIGHDGKSWKDMSADVDLSGAVFGIYSKKDCKEADLVTTMTTNEKGEAKSDLLAAGTYWVKEIQALKDHNLMDEAIEVKVTAGGTAIVKKDRLQDVHIKDKFINQQNNGHTTLRLVKNDELGNALQGAEFGLYKTRRYNRFTGQYECQDLVATAKTNRNGVAVFENVQLFLSAEDSTYYIQEIAAPYGYIADNRIVEVKLDKDRDRDKIITIDGNGKDAGNAFVNDIIRGSMAVAKVDAVTGYALPGAEFTIYEDAACTKVAGTMETKLVPSYFQQLGIATKNGLIPGTYYVKETKAPNQYMLPDPNPVYTVKVKPDEMTDVVTGKKLEGQWGGYWYTPPENFATAIENDQVINIAGSKVWYDEGFEGSRPQEIQVNLYKGEDTNPYRSVTVSQQTDWKFSFPNLRRYDDEGKEIVYTVKEDLRGNGHLYYTYVKENEKDGNVTVTIANAVKKTMITGTKTWEDTAGYDPDRPNDITFSLLLKDGENLVPVKDQNGQLLKAVGGSYNNYKFEFRDLPSYDAEGNKAEYVVQEAESDKYVLVDVTSESKTEQGNTYLEFSLVNRLTVPLKGTKVWQDSSNADGNRPENVTLVVFRNGERMQPQPEIEWDKETDTDVWTWKVSGLPKYDENNNLLTYTVKEEPVPAGYTGTVSEDGLTFYNTKLGSIRLYKVSNANQPLNGAEFKLYRDEACQNPVSDTVYVTAQTGPTRNGFIEIVDLAPGDYYIREEKAPEGFALPVPNKPIKVTVVAGQIARVNGEHGVVVNVPDSESTTIAVTKAWAGDEDKMDARPKSVTVQLFQNNAPMDGRTMELTADNNWQGEFTKLPGKDANGNAYTYTVKETAVVPGYLSAVTGSVENGFTITNTYSYTSISVKKEWKGLATLEGLPEVTVQLKANDVAVDGKTVVLSSANNWEASFDQLPIKDENGNEIAYSVEETTVLPDFNVSYSGDKDNGFVVTNTVAGGQITLKKVDADNPSTGLQGAVFGVYSDQACQNKVTEMTTDNNGNAKSIELAPGTYWVKETKAPVGYKLSDTKYSVTVVKDTATPINNGNAITNVYGAKGEWTLTAGKTVDGQTATEDQVFDFGLYENGILVGEVVKNQAGTITFPKVIYTEEDAGKEFTYTVKELGFSGTASDTFSYVCDPTVFTVIVKVEDADGQLTTSWKTDDGKTAITFENTRLWKVALEKSDRNDTSIKLPGAVYTLYKDAACTEKYADITTGVGGVGFLMNVPAGTYWVKETKAPAGYEVDPEAYEVKVPNGEDISKPVFVPVSDYPMEGNLTLDVEKVMDGRAFQAGDTFTFTISALSGTPMPEKTMVTIMPESGNTAKVDFGKIEFTFEDVGKTYEYTVKETAGDIQGITYDTKFHTATVKVSEGSNENIIATVTYSDGEKMILTNTYTASNELKLDVEKAITGRTFMAGDSFTFTVEAAENVPMPEKTEVTVEPTSGTVAVVDFGKITYSQADVGKTYEYTVKEKAGEAGGIAYDETAYTVKVQITANGDGTLTVTPAYEKGSRITFTNAYTANGAYQLKAVKHLDGKALEEGQFTFVLMNGDGKELETAKNGADGSIAFKAMTFNQNDVGKTYAYRIAERNEGVLGYIYDATVYDVKLSILDNGDGTLTVKADGIPESGMVFENVFNELASFTVRKEWQGKEGLAITLILYRNGQKMETQPQYVKNGNLYIYENLPVYDENDKKIVYSVKEAFMDGYMTIYENTGDYAKVTDQVMNGGKIINRSVTDFAVKKVWEGLTEGEEAPAITLTLYCNGQKVDKPTPTPDKNGWYHYYNLPATVNGEEAVYTVVEEALDGFAASYLHGSVEVEEAGNGDTIVNRKIPKTGDESMIGLWSGITVLSGAAFILLMKKRKAMN